MPKIEFEVRDDVRKRLNQMKKRGDYQSLGDLISESLGIRATMQTLQDQGFVEVVMVNPETSSGKQIKIPSPLTRPASVPRRRGLWGWLLRKP